MGFNDNCSWMSVGLGYLSCGPGYRFTPNSKPHRIEVRALGIGGINRRRTRNTPADHQRKDRGYD